MVKFSQVALFALLVSPSAAFQPAGHLVDSSVSTTRRNAATVGPSSTQEPLFKMPNFNNNNKNDNDEEPRTGAMTMDLDGIAPSGLGYKALSLDSSDFPQSKDLRAVIPADCFESDTALSLGYLGVSLAGTALCTLFGVNMLSVLPPENLLTLPFWTLYSAVTGTVAMGLWVLAHECGHGAFSSNRNLRDAVGYILHSVLLVPYFSWQRSHAVHHQYTNHMVSSVQYFYESLGLTPLPSSFFCLTSCCLFGSHRNWAKLTSPNVSRRKTFWIKEP